MMQNAIKLFDVNSEKAAIRNIMSIIRVNVSYLIRSLDFSSSLKINADRASSVTKPLITPRSEAFQSL